ncbi:MAG: hypothetical protein AAF412_09515 [Pseudomonadota bacterium]
MALEFVEFRRDASCAVNCRQTSELLCALDGGEEASIKIKAVDSVMMPDVTDIERAFAFTN